MSAPVWLREELHLRGTRGHYEAQRGHYTAYGAIATCYSVLSAPTWLWEGGGKGALVGLESRLWGRQRRYGGVAAAAVYGAPPCGCMGNCTYKAVALYSAPPCG